MDMLNFDFVLSSLFIEILGIICIVFICLRVCDVINFKINSSFLKLFSYTIKKIEVKF